MISRGPFVPLIQNWVAIKYSPVFVLVLLFGSSFFGYDNKVWRIESNIADKCHSGWPFGAVGRFQIHSRILDTTNVLEIWRLQRGLVYGGCADAEIYLIPRLSQVEEAV